MSSVIKDLADKFPDMNKKKQAVPQPGASQSAVQPPPAAPPARLNAANLQEQQQQLNKIHQRSNSRSQNTPAAPTSAQPPFQLGATSPHGTPAYAKKNPVEMELHIPARKKQKKEPGQGTPGSSSSPRVSKAVSPEMRRQQQPDSKSQQRVVFYCKEPQCERHASGYNTEEELKRHTQEEHIAPLEDPGKYFQENLALSTGLDAQGQPKKPATVEPGPTSAKMAPSNSKQGQTPNIKAGNTPGSATPMMKQASMNRQASATGLKPNPQSNGINPKEAVKATQKDTKQLESQAVPEMDPWANSTLYPNELLHAFQPFETGASGSIADLNVFRGITPNDTPESSKDGVSEPNSDISDGVGLDINIDLFDDSWMPFGPGAPDSGLGDLSFADANVDDLLMFDESEPNISYQSFEDFDASTFEKPFSLDTTFFSLDGS